MRESPAVTMRWPRKVAELPKGRGDEVSGKNLEHGAFIPFNALVPVSF